MGGGGVCNFAMRDSHGSHSLRYSIYISVLSSCNSAFANMSPRIGMCVVFLVVVVFMAGMKRSVVPLLALVYTFFLIFCVYHLTLIRGHFDLWERSLLRGLGFFYLMAVFFFEVVGLSRNLDFS